jgi:Protein of unknown function (DUF1353)
MSNFTQPLMLSPSGALWKTERELDYEIGAQGSGLFILVPQGFKTDLGTIPVWARAFINPADAKCAAAFVLHDFLCTWSNFSRTVTDAILFEALIVLATPRWKALLIHFGVSLYRLAFVKGGN